MKFLAKKLNMMVKPSRMDSDSSPVSSQFHNDPPLSNDTAKLKQPQNLKLDTLTRLQVMGYSVGHFQNDLCAACWFNYLLYFMKNVVFRTDPDSGFYAGYLLMNIAVDGK